jgi:hypothetical protein
LPCAGKGAARHSWKAQFTSRIFGRLVACCGSGERPIDFVEEAVASGAGLNKDTWDDCCLAQIHRLTNGPEPNTARPETAADAGGKPIRQLNLVSDTTSHSFSGRVTVRAVAAMAGVQPPMAMISATWPRTRSAASSAIATRRRPSRRCGTSHTFFARCRLRIRNSVIWWAWGGWRRV